jgi:hypothetical protein
MSSPSSLPSFSRFSLLPFELVQQIIESSVPYNFHSTTYRDRQNTLLSLCLVSRLFHQISKPLLWAVVRITEHNRHVWLSVNEEEKDSRMPQTQELIVDAKTEKQIVELGSIFQPQLHLTKVIIWGFRTAEIDIGVLSNLERKRLFQSRRRSHPS